jgi:hypothetical protein
MSHSRAFTRAVHEALLEPVGYGPPWHAEKGSGFGHGEVIAISHAFVVGVYGSSSQESKLSRA